MLRDNPWQMEAKCANDPIVQDEINWQGYDRFHDTKDESVRRYCKSCPVIKDCLDYAMDMLKLSKELSNPLLVPWGVWGGTTMKERSLMLRRQRQTEVKIQALLERMKAPHPDTDIPNAS